METQVLPVLGLSPHGDLTRHKQNPQTTIAVSVIDLTFGRNNLARGTLFA